MAQRTGVKSYIEYESLNNLVRAMNLIGVISGELDWNKYVDESYLPADLQSKKK